MNVIGLGVDLVDVHRVKGILERDPRFVRRIFSDDEIDYCDRSPRRAECYAVRWAAREACAKALGGIPEGRWRDIRISRADDGAVTVELDGAARARAEELGADQLLVSLAHERDQALAFCLVLKT